MATRPRDGGQNPGDGEQLGFFAKSSRGMFTPLPITFTVLRVVTVQISHLDWEPLQGRAVRPEIHQCK